MGNKSSTPELNKTITIHGFGGETTLPSNIVGELPTLTGKYVISEGKIDRSRISINEIRNTSTPKSITEVATLTTTEPQEIKINGTKYSVTPYSYSISKTQDGKHTLINDSENPLETLIVPVKTGGRRKRQTKGRKAKKYSRRRRSIRA